MKTILYTKKLSNRSRISPPILTLSRNILLRKIQILFRDIYKENKDGIRQ